MAKRWWAGDQRQRYWLEATDRDDMGTDLRAPLTDASGAENWRYTLFQEAAPGDVVFHYDSREVNGIVAWSRVAGPFEPYSITWKARGSYARDRGAVPEEQPGYRVPLENYTTLSKPLTLDQLRFAETHLKELVTALEATGKRPLYFPFELSDRRPLRPMQGYAFKLPAAFVVLFPELQTAELGPWVEPVEQDAKPRNPPWSRDELILALDLYLTSTEQPLQKRSSEVVALSQLLGQMARITGRSANLDYRNANGVYMKLMNFRRVDPAYIDTGRTGLQRGNKDEAVVWAEFAADRTYLGTTAAAIRSALTSSDAGALLTTDDDGIEEAAEGRILTRLHRVRERSRALVEARKAQELKAHGCLRCEACSFDFHQRYGDRGHGFIEAHHTRPVHTLIAGGKTQLRELALLCANCHRMIHARRQWLSVPELQTLLRA